MADQTASFMGSTSSLPQFRTIMILLIAVLCTIAAPDITYAKPEAYSFINFSRQVSITPTDGDWYILSGYSTVRVKLANRLIVKVSPDMDKTKLRKALRKADHSDHQITELYRMRNGIYYLVSFSNSVSLQRKMERIRRFPFVMLVQPDLLQERNSSEIHRNSRGLFNSLKSIKVPQSWMVNQGKGVRIAIIDDGFDLEHEDLQGTNVAFVYDVDAKTLNASPKLSLDSHGTQVAGVIFARHNGIGVDGIAPQAELVALRSTHTWTSDLLLSFYLAKINKADIINCSWSSDILLEPVADVIGDLAHNGRNGKGIAVVFAAGNQGKKLEQGASEAALPEVISVGAAGPKGRHLRFSNYGPYVDLYAPGIRIRTTKRGNHYGFFSGTSAAAPIVSGLIALDMAVNPNRTLNDIEQDMVHYFEGIGER